jgi:MtN3 and saliva related transmembrane protein
MNNQIVESIGLLGSFLSSITFLPQVIQVYKTKSAKDLSLNMLLIIITSCIVWLVYGVAKNLLPVIICNAIILCLSGWLAWFKWKTDKSS